MNRAFAVLLLALLVQPALAQQYYVREVSTFVSPDGSFEVLAEFVGSAKHSLYINIYTIESPEVAELIASAKARGVDVVLLVDRAPAGRISDMEKLVLGRLLSSGVNIYYWQGKERFDHAKYAVADNRSVLITTENLGESGFPKRGSGNRGWGVVIYDASFAQYFLDLFFRDLQSAEKVRHVEEARYAARAPENYNSKFEAKRYQGVFLAVPLTAPEDAAEKILALINSANRSVYVEQFYVYTYWGGKKTGSPQTTPNLFLEAAINASRRGSEVKILLDSTWYNVEKDDPTSNHATVKYVEEVAKRENLNLQIKLADLSKLRLEKLHVKGVVVDDYAALVSSVNWNEHSPRKNRETGVIIYGEPAKYFGEVFICDWNGGCPGMERKIEIMIISSAALLVAAIYLRRKRL